MRLTFISDTHLKHGELKLGSGDILFHCGDMTNRGNLSDLREFARFMSNQDFKHKVAIAGNHDFCFENENKDEAERILLDNGIIYLNDSGVSIEGLKIWGSPVQPWFHDWAFNRQRGSDIKKHWDLIPDDTDILITHGPPYGILDMTIRGQLVGCEELLERVTSIKPKIHAFGHIHESAGVTDLNGIKFVNACVVDLRHRISCNGITVEL